MTGLAGGHLDAIRVTNRNGPSLSLGGELGGIGAGYDLWSANARIDWPF